MDNARRERIRELIGMLDYIQGQVEAYQQGEQRDFDTRSPSSKETEKGIVSKEAADSLDRAASDIYSAIEQLRSAVGDDSEPEPAPTPFKRRTF
jgi:hypothetical protein